MRQHRKVIVGLVMLAIANEALANEVREFSLEKKVRQSALVVIGSVMSIKQEPISDVGMEYARIRVDTILKGKMPNDLYVLTRGPISEMDPRCCEVGGTYLFFLGRLPNGRFESVNGPFGIYPIKK